MFDTAKAVFLSYASQDAEAARRICDALRAAGVEVWFDQSELVGGDAWDAKIRRQIKECALFVPVVSAATQARREGYFRLEWKLADDRTQLMAKGTPFLLPVCIDDTKDWDAIVPDSFMVVQWTRLRQGYGGQALDDASVAAFAERVRKLVSGEAGADADRPRPRDAGVAAATADKADNDSSRDGAESGFPPAVRVVVPVLVIAAAVWFWQRRSEPAPVANATAPATVVAPMSKSHELVAKARALFENPNYTGDDLKLAEELCQQATKLDPNDAEVWAVYAELSGEMIGGGTDLSAARMEATRIEAERAVALDSTSNEAQFAKASYLRRMGGDQKREAEQILRDLLRRTPDNPRVLISLGKAIWGNIGGGRTTERADEALQFFAQAAAIPSARAEALRERAWLLSNLGRLAEAEAALDPSIALQPAKSGFFLKIRLALIRGDVAEARGTLARISSDALRADQGAALAARVWLWSREPAKCLGVLEPVQRDYLSSNFYRGPTDALRGRAYAMEGKAQAAQNAWGVALRVVEQRLVDRPRGADLLGWRAELLARRGEREAATTALRLFEEIGANGSSQQSMVVHVLLEPADAAVAQLERMQSRASPVFSAGELRFDPDFEPIRSSPRFQALLEKFPLEVRESPAANAPAAAGK